MWHTACFSILALAIGIVSADASVNITVDKSRQRLTVVVDGVPRYEWPVSTARWGYNTPNGTYRPQRLERSWYSRKYDMSPMPYSIFFAGGYAIHGSYEVSHLGRPASHGCIRLSPAHAATLFALVQGRAGNTNITVTGAGPSEYVAGAREREYTPPRAYDPYSDVRSGGYHYEGGADFGTVFNSGPPRYRGYNYGPRYWNGY
jgi:L,D-transpeptidase catalytic domain